MCANAVKMSRHAKRLSQWYFVWQLSCEHTDTHTR